MFLKPSHRSCMFFTHSILHDMHNNLHEHISDVHIRLSNRPAHLFSAPMNRGAVRAVFSFTHLRSMEKELDTIGWTSLRNCSFLKEPMDELEKFFSTVPDKVNGENIW